MHIAIIPSARPYVRRSGLGWSDRTLYLGKFIDIRQAVADGTHFVELHGNAKEGWVIYMGTTALPDLVVQVSPLFAPEFGDTRRALMDACERAFGVRPKHTRKYH